MQPQHWPLLGITLAVIVALCGRVYLPWAGRPSGALVRRVPLSLLGRIRLHGVAGVVVLAAATLGVVAGLLPLTAIVVVLFILALLLALPMSYTLTTDGIVAGRTPMR